MSEDTTPSGEEVELKPEVVETPAEGASTEGTTNEA